LQKKSQRGSRRAKYLGWSAATTSYSIPIFCTGHLADRAFQIPTRFTPIRKFRPCSANTKISATTFSNAERRIQSTLRCAEFIQQITDFHSMVEVQYHGFSFEKWVRDTLFQGYTGNYMQKWDIPPDINFHRRIPEELRNLPVSVKAAKYGSPIALGDVLRQRSIDTPFVMIVGFWRQRTSSQKWFEEIGVAHFTVESWNALWGSLSLDAIQKIDTQIKSLALPYQTARTQAQNWKQQYANNSNSQIVINPKIDSKRQRRIQCSMPFDVFWRFAGRKPSPHDAPLLYGFPFKNPVISGSRSFNQE
jgi:hypothetical protein